MIYKQLAELLNCWLCVGCQKLWQLCSLLRGSRRA